MDWKPPYVWGISPCEPLNGHVAGTSQCLVPEIAIIGWLVIWILWFLLVQAWFCGHSTTSCVWKGFVWRWSLSQNRWLEYARMIEPYMSQVCPLRFLIWGGKFLICKHPEIESPYTQRLLVIPSRRLAWCCWKRMRRGRWGYCSEASGENWDSLAFTLT